MTLQNNSWKEEKEETKSELDKSQSRANGLRDADPSGRGSGRGCAQEIEELRNEKRTIEDCIKELEHQIVTFEAIVESANIDKKKIKKKLGNSQIKLLPRNRY